MGCGGGGRSDTVACASHNCMVINGAGTGHLPLNGVIIAWVSCRRHSRGEVVIMFPTVSHSRLLYNGLLSTCWTRGALWGMSVVGGL